VKFFKPTQLVSSVILVVLFGGYGSAKPVLDRFITIDNLRIDKPSLVGHSWGAAPALAYALKYPHDALPQKSDPTLGSGQYRER